MASILALTNGSPHSWMVIDAIAAAHGPVTVMIEPAEPKLTLVRNRLKKQKFLAVLGQVGFVFWQKLVAKRREARIAELTAGINIQPFGDIRQVASVNAPETRQIITQENPDVIVVFGTRLISRETLAAIKVPLINFHSGINPKYRGQAGGYWALALGDKAHAGVTAHLIDAGVDTGAVLYHGNFEATPRDDYVTYFYLQTLAMRPLAVQVVADALQKKLKPWTPNLPSQQFYHPTLWFYFWTGITKGVW